jgi:demethylmenaquinone methyltransferase / 2-methoxy-6-polyprenyl-1,4-benzoquinol methylase
MRRAGQSGFPRSRPRLGRTLLAPVTAAADNPSSPRKRHALALFAGLPGRYERMGAVLSFGQDPRWRRALAAAIDPRPGQLVLDVATGTGLVAFELARRGGCEVVGLDQSEQMLARARARLAGESTLAGRVRFVHGEAERLPFADAQFDALTFTYLLRYVDDREATLRELARFVKPGGRIGMVEFAVPGSAPLRAGWRLHTRVGLPLLGRLVSPAWLEVGRFLGPNIEQLHADVPDLPALWRRAGIGEIHQRRMSLGAGLVLWGVVGGEPGVGGDSGGVGRGERGGGSGDRPHGRGRRGPALARSCVIFTKTRRQRGDNNSRNSWRDMRFLSHDQS